MNIEDRLNMNPPLKVGVFGIVGRYPPRNRIRYLLWWLIFRKNQFWLLAIIRKIEGFWRTIEKEGIKCH